MAKIEFDMQGPERVLEALGRPQIRRIVEAGADVAVSHMSERIAKLHRLTGDMAEGVRKGEYRESVGGGSQVVYPQGTDRHGTENALKAFVINYGRGGTRRRGRMGDRFMTRDPEIDGKVADAMQAESDRIVDEINRA